MSGCQSKITCVDCTQTCWFGELVSGGGQCGLTRADLDGELTGIIGPGDGQYCPPTVPGFQWGVLFGKFDCLELGPTTI